MAKKRKPGRPRVNPDNMSRVFQVRCTEADYERWKGKADALRLPLGAWVRIQVLVGEKI